MRHTQIVHSKLTRSSLQDVPLPPKIKCHRCEKNLPTVKFSEKQLNDFRAQIYQTYGENTTSRIICRKCIGGAQAIVELECTVCGKTKALDAFAKSQRKVPDTAVCAYLLLIVLADVK